MIPKNLYKAKQLNAICVSIKRGGKTPKKRERCLKL